MVWIVAKGIVTHATAYNPAAAHTTSTTAAAPASIVFVATTSAAAGRRRTRGSLHSDDQVSRDRVEIKRIAHERTQ